VYRDPAADEVWEVVVWDWRGEPGPWKQGR